MRQIKYHLGVTINRFLSMRYHVKLATGKAKVTHALLRPVFASNLPLHTKIGIYKLYVRSALSYAAPAWYGQTKPTKRKRLQAQQSLALPAITSAPRHVSNHTLSRELRIGDQSDYIRRLAVNMFMSVQMAHDGTISVGWPHYTQGPQTSIRRTGHTRATS